MHDTDFEGHLEDLKKVLSQLQGDIESASDDVVQDWYNKLMGIIYSFEDEIDGSLYQRLGTNEDSCEDGEVLLDAEDAEEMEYIEEQDSEVFGNEMYDGCQKPGGGEADKEDPEGILISQIAGLENSKIITININLPNPY
jgi:hypothetical protein